MFWTSIIAGYFGLEGIIPGAIGGDEVPFSLYGSRVLALVRGDSYQNSDGNAWCLTARDDEPWPADLSGWTIDVSIAYHRGPTVSVPGAIIEASGAERCIMFELSTDDTAEAGDGLFDVQLTKGSSVRTPVKGVVTAVQDVTVPEE